MDSEAKNQDLIWIKLHDRASSYHHMGVFLIKIADQDFFFIINFRCKLYILNCAVNMMIFECVGKCYLGPFSGTFFHCCVTVLLALSVEEHQY